MAAVLKDRNLQHVMLCDPDPSIATRLAYWLDHVLYQEFFCGERDKSRCEELLVMLVKFSDFLQVRFLGNVTKKHGSLSVPSHTPLTFDYSLYSQEERSVMVPLAIDATLLSHYISGRGSSV